jgi:hypothetical protein
MLLAKKKKKTVPKGQGFGKTTPSSVDHDDDDHDDTDDATASTTTTATSTSSSSESSPFVLESLAATAAKRIESSDSESPSAVVDTTPVAVRTQRILRDKYGLKPLSEQQSDWTKPASSQSADNDIPQQQQQQQQVEQEFDIMTKLPPPVLLAIDRFLKVGLTISAILFIAAGLGVTWEAWSVTSHSPIPDDIDRFIVDVVEPNFTKGLFVLLGFSVSLGIFASAQLGSQSSQYRED